MDSDIISLAHCYDNDTRKKNPTHLHAG